MRAVGMPMIMITIIMPVLNLWILHSSRNSSSMSRRITLIIMMGGWDLDLILMRRMMMTRRRLLRAHPIIVWVILSKKKANKNLKLKTCPIINLQNMIKMQLVFKCRRFQLIKLTKLIKFWRSLIILINLEVYTKNNFWGQRMTTGNNSWWVTHKIHPKMIFMLLQWETRNTNNSLKILSKRKTNLRELTKFQLREHNQCSTICRIQWERAANLKVTFRKTEELI